MAGLRALLTPSLRNRLLIQIPSRDLRISSVSNDTYTTEQKQLILNRLNDKSSPSRNLPKKVAQAVHDRLDKTGQFGNLEELLELPGVGPKSLRNICDKILNDDESQERPRPRSKIRKSASLAPKLNKKVSSLVSVFVDSCAVSWAKLKVESKSVVDWDLQNFESDSLELTPLLQQAVNLEKLLPEADLYVLEDSNKSAYAKGNSKSLSLTCMLSTVVHLKRDTDNSGRIVFLKSRLVDRHFNAIVGNETVSLQPIVEDMIQGESTPSEKLQSNRYSRFHIGPPLAAHYMKRKAPYEKELLSRAALIGVCLIDLSLLND